MKEKKKTVERLISTIVLLTITISALAMYPKNAQPEFAEPSVSEVPVSEVPVLEVPVSEVPVSEVEPGVQPVEDDAIPITQDGIMMDFPPEEELPAKKTESDGEDFEAEPPEQKGREDEERSFVDGLENPVDGYCYGQPVPESEAVEDGYFSDAAFIGNSLEQGFMLYAGLNTPDYFATQSISVGNICTERVIQVGEEEYITILSALSKKQYGKIYIMLGINEVDWKEEDFVERYETLIDILREQQPEAELYLQSITPIATKLEIDTQKFTKERVTRFNELIQRVARKKRAHYLYVYESMADENGDLPEGKSSDGIHPYRPLYQMWRDYLKVHTIREVKE